MSLNGLDTAPVQEAYSQCQHEAGGWFLLKYVSRDQVELHGRGKNGVHEARNAIACYTEASPLYGLIIYRRRKVLIKYIPEGTSRLLQARTAVHFQDILERYSPYETLLEITTADALNDTALAASFPLHTASPAIMSNKLQEISEDAEDSGATPRSPSSTSDGTGAIFGTQRYNMEKRVDQIMRADRPERPSGRFSPSVYSPKDRASPSLSTSTSASLSPHKTSVSQFLVRDDAGRRSVSSWSTSPSASPIAGTVPALSPIDNATIAEEASPIQTAPSDVTEPSPAMQSSTSSWTDHPVAERSGSKSTEATKESSDEPTSAPTDKLSEAPVETEEKKDDAESTRTEITPGPKADDPYDFSYLYKPKVKLGPRVVTTTKRAVAAASLPASYKSAARKSDADPPKSGAARLSTQASQVPTPPPIPVMPEYNPRPISRGSVKSIPSHRSSASIADRSRLQKALELRKRKMQRANMQEPITAPVPEETEHAPQPIPEPIREVPTPTPSEDAGEENRTASSAVSADSGVSLDDSTREKRSEQRLSNVVSVDRTIPEEPPVSSPSEAPLPQPQVTENEPLQEDVPEPATSLEAPSAKESAEYVPDLATSSEAEPTEAPAEQEDLPVGAAPTEPVAQPEEETGDEERPASREELATETCSSTGEHPGPRAPAPATVDHQRPDSHAGSSNISDGPEDEFSTPQSVKQEPIDQAEIIASLQRAASASPRALVYSPLSIRTTPPTRVPYRSAPQESREWDSEPTMSLEMLDEISIAFMPAASSPDYPAPKFKPENVGLGIQGPRAETAASNQPMSNTNQSAPDTETTNAPAWTPLRQQEQQGLERTEDESEATEDEDDELLDELETATLHEAGSVTVSPIDSNMRKPSMSSVHSTHSVRPVNIRRVSSLQQDTVPISPTEPDLARHPSYSRSLTPRPIEVYEPSGIARSGKVSLGISKRIDNLEEATIKGSSPLYQAAIVDALQKSTSRSGSISPSSLVRNAQSPSPSADPVSVRARIIRPRSNAGSDETATLQKSDLVVNYRPPPPPAQKIAVSPIREDFPSPTMNPSRPSTHGGRQSVSSVADSEESTSHKEGRASRLFKRMSNWSAGSKRRSNAVPASPTTSVPEVPSVAARAIPSRDGSEHPPAVMVGDLNVQFPDSLLWKRRIVEIDDAGHMVFSTLGTSNGHKSGGASKKYHLKDFKIPYTPDLERQELPCSLVLDFLDGTPPIQVACEDNFTQRQVLFILRTHWKGYAGL